MIAKILVWLDEQWIWIKSFISETKANGTIQFKGSSKRIASLMVVFVFAYTYIKTSLMTAALPDIPEGWRWMLFIVLGVNGLADVIKTKLLK